ncbi:MAG: LysR family transcriptional regulator [Myxococcota bacterium]
MENKLPAWDDLRVLLAVHRGGSFLAAGLELGLSTSTVARRIGALEHDLGHALVHRTSQGARIETGALALIKLAQDFEQSLAAHRRDTRSSFVGVVRVSLPDGFAIGAAEAAARFCRLHPETSVEVISELRFVDLAAREADIGVRTRPSSSPVLIDKPLGALAHGLYASEDYLARRLPRRFLGAGDYEAQDFVVEDELPGGRGAAQWLIARGARRFPFRSNATDARLHAAKSGLGLVVYGIGEGPRHPGLVRVDLEAPLPTIPFFLTLHHDLRKIPRIRGFAAAFEAVFAEHMAAQQAVLAQLAVGRG